MKNCWHYTSIVSLITAAMLCSSCGNSTENKEPSPHNMKESMTSAKKYTTPSGLIIETIVEPVAGAQEVKKGNIAVVHYTGWLDQQGEKGKKFDSSKDRNQPFEFVVGAGQVIKGWDEGVNGMKIGEKRVLVVPSQLGYGARGAGNVIPANATLIFEVELLSVKK
jgi:FKBP-type peptidyl-prolyl cis-trans isomerase